MIPSFYTSSDYRIRYSHDQLLDSKIKSHNLPQLQGIQSRYASSNPEIYFIKNKFESVMRFNSSENTLNHAPYLTKSTGWITRYVLIKLI